MSKEVSNLDNGEELKITIHKGQTFEYVFNPSVPDVLDLVNSKIYITDNERCKVLKEYVIGDGLEVVETTKIRWTVRYDDLQGMQDVSFDAFLINTSYNLRTFKGKIRVNNSWKYQN